MAGLGMTVLAAVWLFLPAYLANMSPVFVGGGRPIDGGRVHRDGRRVLGDGKSWRGLFLAPLVAALLTLALHALARYTAWGEYGFDDFGAPHVAFVMAYGLGFGALVGDATESYFKRRRGMKRGEMWLGFDQLDFVVGAFVVGWLLAFLLQLVGLTSGHWMGERWPWERVAVIVVLTPALHLLVNYIGWKIGKKDVPW